MPKVLLHTIKNFHFHTKKRAFAFVCSFFNQLWNVFAYIHTKTIMDGFEVLSLCWIESHLSISENLSEKNYFFLILTVIQSVTYVHFLRRVQTFSNAIFTCHCYGKKSYFSFYFLTLFLPKLHCIYTTCNGRHAHTCTSINHKISSQILIRYCVHVFAPFFFSFLFFSLQFCSIWFGVVILLS